MTGHHVLTFATAFAGAVGLWWIYFDRAAADSAREIEASPDPGRLARNAFHWIHPVIIGGIIVEASAGERLFEDPVLRGDATFAWLLLGGVALFLGGHALFKAVVWHRASWPRLGGIVALATARRARPARHASDPGDLLGRGHPRGCVADRLTHPVAAGASSVTRCPRRVAGRVDERGAAIRTAATSSRRVRRGAPATPAAWPPSSPAPVGPATRRSAGSSRRCA